MRKIVLSLMYVCLACIACQAQGVKFETGTWEEVLAKAKTENKIIFVDIYTKWCGPCKMVAKTVFPDEKMGEYYNAHFINLQIDAESPAGKEFVKKYPVVGGYPTFYFIDGNGEVVFISGGGMKVDRFIATGKTAQLYARHGGQEKIQRELANGSASKELLRDYYDFCSRSEKPSILNLYLKKLTNEELANGDNAQLFEGITLYDSGLMNRLVEITRINPEKSFTIQYRISTFLSECIAQGNEKWLDELLALKEKFNTITGVIPNEDLTLVNGRGLFFASPEYIKLCFWTKNGTNEDGFNAFVTRYMEKLIRENPVDSVFKNNRFDIVLAQVKAFKTGEIRTNLPLPKEMQKEIIAEPLVTPSMTVQNILEWTHYFWTLSPSNKKTRELCSQWIDYAFGLNSYCWNTALATSDLLARIGNFKEAKTILEKAIANQKEIDTTNPQVYKTLERKLRNINNGKL